MTLDTVWRTSGKGSSRARSIQDWMIESSYAMLCIARTIATHFHRMSGTASLSARVHLRVVQLSEEVLKSFDHQTAQGSLVAFVAVLVNPLGKPKSGTEGGGSACSDCESDFKKQITWRGSHDTPLFKIEPTLKRSYSAIDKVFFVGSESLLERRVDSVSPTGCMFVDCYQ